MTGYTISAEDRDRLIQGVEQAEKDMRTVTAELAVLMAKVDRFHAVLDMCDLTEFEAVRGGTEVPAWVTDVRRAAVEERDIGGMVEASIVSLGTSTWRTIRDARKALNEQINQAAQREAEGETA
jgi:hypothetical protein